jgi:hypothetical protein
MRAGDVFIGVDKNLLSTDDFSVIDIFGHRHHYTCCNLPVVKKEHNEIEFPAELIFGDENPTPIIIDENFNIVVLN